MASHEELVAELPKLEKLSNAARLKHAKKRRQKQLKKYQELLRLDRQTVGSSLKKRTPSKVNFEEGSLLCDFVSRNDIIGAEKLLKQGVDPNISNADGLTPLHKCCIDNSIEMAEILLEYGAHLNSRDIEGWTPLHAAAATGNVQLISILVDSGANLVAINHDDNMPVDVAADSDIKYILQTKMLEEGHTEDMIEYLHKSVPVTMLADLKDTMRNNRDINLMDKYGATALHIAAANGYKEVLEFLLSLDDTDVDAQDNEGWTPFMAAVCWNQREAMEKLAAKGANLDMKNLRGETAYVIAEDPETRQFILELRGQYGQSQEINLEEMEVEGDLIRRPRRMSVKRTRQQDKEGLAKQSAQAEAMLRKQSLVAQDIEMGINFNADSNLLKEEIADDDCEENVRLIAHAKLTSQDSCLSEVSELGESTALNDITLKEVIDEGNEEEDEEEREEKRHKEASQKQSKANLDRLQSDNSGETVELQVNNHVGERKGENGERVKESNVDDQKPLSPIEKKLSRQELNDPERPTVKRNRFTTQRDPFHKDRAPRKSVLKRSNHPSPVTFEVSSPSGSPTGNVDEDEDENYEGSRQQQMDRKCCTIM